MEELSYPNQYKSMSKRKKQKICNGCGAKGLGGWFVPNTLWGLSIEEACNIHDYEYHYCTREKERNKADDRFLLNMYRIIDNQSGRFLKGIRRHRARMYYIAVKRFGGKHIGNQ